MNVYEIIDRFYPLEDELKKIYLEHAHAVAGFCRVFAYDHPELGIDERFVFEAAMLHDIGIFLTYAPRIHCFGKEEYICHGYLGAQLLRSLGYERHARVCERHTGTGLTKEAIIRNGWNLPARDFLPETVEEQLVCFADKFFSKTRFLTEPRTFEQVVESMRKVSDESVEKVKKWAEMFM